MIFEELLPSSLFQGKVAFIAGGGSGINLGIAKSFGRLGAAVSICGRQENRLRVAAEELLEVTPEVSYQVADVRDAHRIEEVLAETRSRFGSVDIIISGAAGNFLARSESLSSNGFRAVIEIDLIGSFNVARAGFPHLRDFGGSLTFISATHAFVPYAFQAHAGAAKAGVDNLMRNLALEWGRYGIRCNSIAPGPIAHTEGMRRLAPDGAGSWRDMVPLGRMGQISEVSAAAIFLASPLASYVNGLCLTVDGGFSLVGGGVFSKLMERAMGEEG